MKKVMLVCVLAFALVSVAAAQQTLPAGAVGMIEITNLDQLQSRLGEFMKAVDEGAPPAGFIAGGIASLAHSTDPGLMETSQPIRILFFAGDENALEYALVFASKGAAAFKSSIAPTLQLKDEQNGISTYVIQKQVFDMKRYRTATDEEKQDFQKFMSTEEIQVVFGESEGRFVVGRSPEMVESLIKLLEDNTLGQEPILQNGDASIYFDLKRLTDSFGQREGGIFADVRESMDQMASMMPGFPAAIVKAELDAAEQLLAQLQNASLALNIDAEAIRVNAALDAIPESGLAKFFASTPHGAPEILKYAPEDAALVIATRIGDIQPLMNIFVEMNQKMMGATEGASPEMIQLMNELVAAYGDQFVVAMQPGKGINFVEAIRVTKPEIFANMGAKIAPMIKGMTGTMQMTAEDIPYEGSVIEKMLITVAEEDAAGEDVSEETLEMQAQQREAFRSMFGEGMEIYKAVKGNDLLIATGPDALERVQKVIKGEPLAGPAEQIQQIASNLPEDGIGFMYMNMGAFFRWQMMQMGAAMGNDFMANIPEFRKGPGVTATFRTGASSGTMDLIIPSAEIKTIADGMKEF